MQPPPPPRTVPVAPIDQRGTTSWLISRAMAASDNVINLKIELKALIANDKMALWRLATTFSQNVPVCINKSLTPAHILQILPVTDCP